MAKLILGQNDLETWCKQHNHQELLAEWDYEKNSPIEPELVTSGSHQKVWWKCNRNHSWEADIKSRTTRGSGCPYCSGRNAIPGETDLATLRPDLLKEWDYVKNGDLRPETLALGSGKKAWWICPKGHSFSTSIYYRTKLNIGCAVCSGKKILIGFNDLKTLSPAFISEWDYEKNTPLTPEAVTSGSHKKVWWKCNKCNNSWLSPVASRSQGRGCPECSKKQSVDKRNYALLSKAESFASQHPELLEEWDYEKNNALGIIPDNTLPNSNKSVWWKCKKCNYSWKTIIQNRSKGTGCPKCSRKIITEKRTQTLIEQRGSLSSLNTSLLNEWDYEKNAPLTPERVTSGSNKKVWWKCSNGHEWQTTIVDRTNGASCPYCSGRKAVKDVNDLATTNPDLANEWNYEKNGLLTPQDVKAGTNKKVWWKCSKGHEWQAVISSRSTGIGCPYCTNQKVLVGFNDLSTTNPDLIKEWNYEKNHPLTPQDFTPGSGKKVWWKCIYEHEWQAAIHSRSSGTGCPQCNSRGSSLPEQGIAYYLETTCKTEQRQKIFGEEVDVYLSDYKIGIEYDGEFYHRGKESKDKRKEDILSTNGIYVIRIKEADHNEVLDNQIMYVADNLGSNYGWMIRQLICLLVDITSNKSFELIEIHSDSDRLKIREKFNLYTKSNSLAVKNPELSKEWNYEKNGLLTPQMFFSGSGEKVWWKCAKGHEWQAVISSRSAGTGCPYCSGQMVMPGFNDLATTCPDIAKEWNYEKNYPLTPCDVAQYSSKKVWWKCAKGHEWQTLVSNRSSGKNCPVCIGKVVLTGFNDLATTNPDLAKEWNYEKNAPLTPSDVTSGSTKKVWWKCSEGHEWPSNIYNRVKGNGCPICSGRKVLSGANDLATVNPELAKEWNYEKNGELTPQSIRPQSNITVWWKCSNGHEWQARIASRTQGNGCPECAKNKRVVGRRKRLMDDMKGLLTKHPELESEWNYEKNAPLLPSEVTYGSQKKVWWKCANGHEWQAVISDRSSGRGCPFCSGRIVVSGINDLATANPELAKEWDYSKNGELTPQCVKPHSNKTVWWKCSNGHEWQAKINNRTNGNGCPYCIKNKHIKLT